MTLESGWDDFVSKLQEKIQNIFICENQKLNWDLRGELKPFDF